MADDSQKPAADTAENPPAQSPNSAGTTSTADVKTDANSTPACAPTAIPASALVVPTKIKESFLEKIGDAIKADESEIKGKLEEVYHWLAHEIHKVFAKANPKTPPLADAPAQAAADKSAS